MSILKRLGGQIQGLFTILVLILSTTFFFIPVLVIGLLKLIPNLDWRVQCTRWIDSVITFWCDANNAYIERTQNVHWNIMGIEQLNPKDWYLVVANHQSWLDIVILQKLFHRKIPMLKFFIKDELKWVPLLGFSWWAMGSPFMKRYSKEFLMKHPRKMGEDLEATRKALQVFKKTPSSIMNFVEGTRFTKEKRLSQQSPYQHLLKPKSGGISFVISAMGQQIQNLIDVTIVYSGNQPSLWDFLCKRVKSITIHVRKVPIPSQFQDEGLLNETQNQMEFRSWLNSQWAEKDQLIAQFKGSLM